LFFVITYWNVFSSAYGSFECGLRNWGFPCFCHRQMIGSAPLKRQTLEPLAKCRQGGLGARVVAAALHAISASQRRNALDLAAAPVSQSAR
jgi:hypothetical protein